MNKKLITTETDDGTIYGPTRIVYADQVRLEATSRAQGWTKEGNSNRQAAFLHWSALTRTEVTTVTFAEWETHILDMDVESKAEENPTLNPAP